MNLAVPDTHGNGRRETGLSGNSGSESLDGIIISPSALACDLSPTRRCGMVAGKPVLGAINVC